MTPHPDIAPLVERLRASEKASALQGNLCVEGEAADALAALQAERDGLEQSYLTELRLKDEAFRGKQAAEAQRDEMIEKWGDRPAISAALHDCTKDRDALRITCTEFRTQRDELQAENERLRAAAKMCAQCLEDVAQGKGGWAWEEVLTETRAALAPKEPSDG